MIRADRYGPNVRSAFALLLALAFAVRLLAPAGFMPSFASGSMSIVACPDAGPIPQSSDHHGHGKPKKAHAPCPYAASTALGSLPVAIPEILLVLFGLTPIGWHAFLFVRHHRPGERPPSRGPPLPA